MLRQRAQQLLKTRPPKRSRTQREGKKSVVREQIARPLPAIALSPDTLARMASAPLVLPVSLDAESKPLDIQAADASVTSVAVWHSTARSGAALGCADGSFFLLNPNLDAHQSPSRAVSRSSSPAPTSPRMLPQQHHSRDHSPHRSQASRLMNPFTLSSRAAPAVSVSKEQVEAPKNFVDFDPEQERLSALINPQAKATTRRHDEGSHTQPSSTHASSRAQSPLPDTPTSVSRFADAAPPATAPFPELAPFARVFPPRVGQWHGVSALHALDNAQHLLVLQQSGDLSIFELRDGACTSSVRLATTNPRSPPPGATAAVDGAWEWSRLQSVRHNDTVLILVAASETWTLNSCDPSRAEDSTQRARARLALVRISIHYELELLAEWCAPAPAHTISLRLDAQGVPTLYYFDAGVVSQSINFGVAPPPLAPEEAPHASTSLAALNINLPPIQIPNPFKHLRNGHHHDGPPNAKPVPGKVASLITLGDRRVVAAVAVEGNVSGLWFDASASRGAVWSESGVRPFVVAQVPLETWIATSEPPLDVRWIPDDRLVIVTDSLTTTYRRRKSTSALELQQLSSTAVSGTHEVLVANASLVCNLRIGSTGLRRLSVLPLNAKTAKARIAWRAPAVAAPTNVVSAVLPVDLQNVVIGYVDGRLITRPFGLLEPPLPVAGSPSQPDSSARIERLFLFTKENGTKLIFGGSASGALFAWDYPSLTLRKRWRKFATSLAHVVPLSNSPNVGRLRGHVLCVAENGTALIVDPTSFELVCTIPGAPSVLVRVALAEDNLLFFYVDGRVRLWDVKTLEFWRSMAREKAEELVVQGEWLNVKLGKERAAVWERTAEKAGPAIVRGMFGEGEAASTCLLDVRTVNEVASPPPSTFSFIKRSSAITPSASSVSTESKEATTSVASVPDGLPASSTPLPAAAISVPDDTVAAEDIDPDAPTLTTTSPQHIALVARVLPTLLAHGLCDEVDEFCRERLDGGEASVGMSSGHGSVVLYDFKSPKDVWKISPKYTASRLLATVMLLRLCLGFPDWERDASEAIAFYVVGLPDAVGDGFQAPCLEHLSRFWYDPSGTAPTSGISSRSSSPYVWRPELTMAGAVGFAVELRQAARTLFESTAARMGDQQVMEFIERWQHELPTLQPDSEKQNPRAAMALLLTGHLATEKQSLLAVSTLTDIAKSITLYLHDDKSPHRTLAIELCSRGFQIWQHYVDAIEMIRALFGLATNMRKDFLISSRNAGPAARLAVLQIASSSPPLFMATLGLDVVKPQSTSHRKSTMQLIAFLMRKKPLVLYPNLPKLMEAVVKSLDPNNATDRDAVLDSATQILGQVVKTFPNVDFHGASQRLALGTTEGAVLMYDLKSATRLYVLDGHKKRLTALSFSPDGRRLATVSLEESTVLIWKVGTSFSSFFNPGAPPRQGSSGSAPFKTYPFNVGDEARMTIASTLDWVNFEWPADRSARLKIRDSTLTFAT